MKKNKFYHKLLSLRKEKIAPFIDKADNTSRAVTLVINTARKALNQWCKISHYSRTEELLIVANCSYSSALSSNRKGKIKECNIKKSNITWCV